MDLMKRFTNDREALSLELRRYGDILTQNNFVDYVSDEVKYYVKVMNIEYEGHIYFVHMKNGETIAIKRLN